MRKQQTNKPQPAAPNSVKFPLYIGICSFGLIDSLHKALRHIRFRVSSCSHSTVCDKILLSPLPLPSIPPFCIWPCMVGCPNSFCDSEEIVCKWTNGPFKDKCFQMQSQKRNLTKKKKKLGSGRRSSTFGHLESHDDPKIMQDHSLLF